MSVKDDDQRTQWKDGPFQYGHASRLLHWGIVALIMLSFGLAWTWSYPGRGPLQNAMVDIHRGIGIFVLLLSGIRIMRRIWRRPRTLRNEPNWIRLSAYTVQFSLMFLLVLIPVCGWIYTNAGGFEVQFFSVTLPRLVSRDHYLEDIAVELHEDLAVLFLIVLGLHIAGSVRHWMQARSKLTT